jgi:hypothetical protein
MMATHTTKCLSLVKGRRIRVTRLDNCGRPVYGDDSQVVSKGFISVGFTANTTESDEINVTKRLRRGLCLRGGGHVADGIRRRNRVL